MKFKLLALVLLIISLMTFSTAVSADLQASDYAMPETVMAERIEDFYGIWRVSYLVDAGFIFFGSEWTRVSDCW